MDQTDVQLLTPGDVASLLRVTIGSVRHLRRTGQLRGIKVGGKWRYRLEDVRDYIERCEASKERRDG